MRKIGPVLLMVLAIGAVVTAGRSGETGARPKITGISHVRIRVSSYCAGFKFYSEVLGQNSACSPSGNAGAVGGTQVLGSGQFLTLNVHSLHGPAPYGSNLLEEVGFLTEDAAALHRYLESHNIKVSEITGTRPGFTARDPEGHLIEFLEGRPGEGNRVNVPPFTRIIHAGFVVNDRPAVDKFYRDVLGFRLYWHGGMTDDETKWVDMQVPDGTDWIEYMLNIPADADKRTLGVMNHIALGVPDVKEAAKALEAHGVKLTEQPKIGRDGKWQLNLYDPDQTRVELMEFTPTEKPCCAEYTGPHPKP